MKNIAKAIKLPSAGEINQLATKLPPVHAPRKSVK
jgi:hypothetical protein